MERRIRGLKRIVRAAALLICQAVLGGDGLDHWHVRYSAPEGIYFGTVAAGQNRFVAVGRNGRIVTSTDAVQWTLADSGTTVSLENVASGNGAFVATAVPNTVIRSTDGTNWQSAGWQEPATVVRGVDFANGQFLLLATDEGGAGPMLFVSSTGTNWSINRMRPNPALEDPLLLSSAYGNSNYVAVGIRSDVFGLGVKGPLVMISPDTFTWEHIPLTQSFLWSFRAEFTSVTFGNGMFVAVGDGVNLVSFLAYSADGRKWNLAEDVFRGLYSVAYGDGVFVAVGVGQVATSTDGIHWRKRDLTGGIGITGITYGRNTFVGVSGSQLLQSDPIVSLTLKRSSPTELWITGQVGKTYQLEASEDVAATNGWETVASFSLTNSRATWVDSSSTNKSHRFYRAALQP